VYPDEADFNLCCVDISLCNTNYRLICIDRPPGVFNVQRLDCIRLSTFLNSLLTSKRTYFIAGDHNLLQMDWELFIAPDDGIHNVLFDLFTNNSYCLYQIVTHPIRLSNILDIFLTNVPALILNCSLSDPLGASDHDSLVLNILISTNNKKTSFQYRPTICKNLKL